MEFKLMQFLFLVIFQVICMANFSFGKGCPDPATLDEFTCAMVYKDATDDEATSCSGDSDEVINDEETPDLGDFDDKISSLVVREGCTLNGYWKKDFNGDERDFTGLVLNLDHVHNGLGDWDNDISSYKCKCV
ncbi:unnamed protein product [Meganyctiphanes norvegica]|uniref:Uncharacterized protein n=1 Tax=Meganyctiphanes norvegica TaxID=48144 RepID=A0AAV2SJX8_MEGNR